MSSRDNKEKFSSKLTHSFKRAKPAARIMVVFIPLFLLFFIIVFYNVFLSDTDDESEKLITDVSKSRIMAMGGKDIVEKSIIVDSTTKQGKLAASVEKLRVASEARNGGSAFEKLIADKTIQHNQNIPKIENKNNLIANYKPNKIETEKNEVVINKKLLNLLTSNSEVNTEVNTSVKSAPGSADIYSPQELSTDPVAGMSSERYYGELRKRKESIQSKLESAYKSTKSVRSSVTTGFEPYAVVASNDHEPQERRTYVSGINSSQTTGVHKNRPVMLFQPGDKLTAYSDFPIDSRVSKQMVFRVSSKIMRDARISCTFEDKGDFLVPSCPTITFRNKVKPIKAIMLDPGSLSGIIDQDVDNDLLIKSIIKIGVTLLNTAGTVKLATGTKTTETENAVVTENTLSDKEILKAGLATTIGSLGSSGDSYFEKSSVKTIPAHTQVLITFTQPLDDHWGIIDKKNTNNGVW